MAESRNGTMYYKRARFLTHLPERYLYTKSHFWLMEVESGIWRIGMTHFASRMLGDIVDFGFNEKPGTGVEVGQAIGWMEGFKAISDIYCVAEGSFHRQNPELENDITLVDAKPYHEGWLYEVRGIPEPAALDVHGYIAILDATIDRMLGSRHDQEKTNE
ncbi:MAG TPA: glycine cleavage system protein H [Bryobacteraceae bacterium]|nr:glycine cleavage system protein H [Bryobacteraceae bacterium]